MNFLRILIACLILLACLLFTFALVAPAGQTQPDAKRLHEIHLALNAHGYMHGNNWHETQEILRKIADDHGWQVNHAPDARVLILLGLGNKHSNVETTELPGNHLDRAQRGEKD